MVEEIIVTAQRREERILDVPMSISVLSFNEVEKVVVQRIEELYDAITAECRLRGTMSWHD